MAQKLANSELLNHIENSY